MTTLKGIADARPEILKAELAALLHNLGKLSSNFMKSVSRNLGQDYSFAWKQITEPAKTVRLEQSGDYIKKKKGLDLVISLLTEHNWQSRAPAASKLKTNLDEVLSTLSDPPSAPKTVLRHLKKTSEQTSPEIRDVSLEICHDLYGAMQLAKLLQSGGGALWQLHDEDGTQCDFLLNCSIQLGGENHSLAALVLLMWDEMHVPTGGDGRLEALAYWIGQTTNLQRYLVTAHGYVSEAEKDYSPCGKQDYGLTWRGTAFGERRPRQDAFDPADLDKARHELLSVADESCLIVTEFGGQPHFLSEKWHTYCLKRIRKLLLPGLGETQRPHNDVRLWDYVHSIASLYKSALAQTVLDGRWSETDSLRWRLLHASFDGLAFWSKAHRIGDMLGRRTTLQKGLDAIRDVLEVEYPLGNEIYRDENGGIFVVPDREDLLSLTDEHGTDLCMLLTTRFDSAGLSGELVPDISLSAETLRGNEINLAQALAVRAMSTRAEANLTNTWWKNARQENAEICTVCGLRPVGSIGGVADEKVQLERWATERKAKQRDVCCICLERRGRRARDWARNKKDGEEKVGPFERTIWIDEVADDNARVALVVGRFVLDDWLSGKLITTMSKRASFPRIRRCWETTRGFWLDVQNDTIPRVLQSSAGLRLGLRPGNVEEINTQGQDEGLGKWHAFEAEIRGQRLSVCWDPNDKKEKDRNLFWTTVNLRYFGMQLGLKKEDCQIEAKLVNELRAYLEAPFALYEPGGYQRGKQESYIEIKNLNVICEKYFLPFIPLVVEPAIFMALVPADKALTVAHRIKEKYDCEMGRVRDRLPLHLGLVFFPRRTPLRAVMDAGRRMLEMRADWEEWKVQVTEERKASFHRDDLSFEHTYPSNMGDGETPDRWYPHLLVEDPSKTQTQDSDGTLNSQIIDAVSGSVFIRPCRFDFEFLDTTGRRFEIYYDKDGRRSQRPTRPFLLDDLDRFKAIWTKMEHLAVSQRHQVIHTIEATREAWFGRDAQNESWRDPPFKQFVRDTLAGAAWGSHPWKDIPLSVRKKMVRAGVTGELADLAELHMQIIKEKESKEAE